MNCALCNLPDAVPAFNGATWDIAPGGRAFTYRRCLQCKTIFCHPQPTGEELEKYYDTSFNYGWYERRRLLKRWQGRHRWAVTSHLLKANICGDRTLLDVGCGEGWYLEAARRAGWSVTGLELSGSAVRFARDQLKLDVRQQPVEQYRPLGQAFAAATMWHSLEHISTPETALRSVAQTLQKDGILLIAVPNVEAIGLTKVGASWVWLQQPFVHLWHFSATSLESLCNRAGLEVVCVATRDTWDAQAFYDTFFHRISRWRLGRILIRLVVPNGGSNSENGIVGRSQFYLCEAARLSSYFCYLARLRLTGRSDVWHNGRTDGSELLILARRKNAIG